MKQIHNQLGFTMIELVLSLTICAIIVGVASQIMQTHINAYSFITNRHTALSDASYALNRITYELLRIKTADILAVNNNSISFLDMNGANATFATGINGGNTALFRGAELLVTPIQSFDVAAYDQNNILTMTIANIRKFKITITTAPVDTEGSLTLSTMITPRAFVYANYQ